MDKFIISRAEKKDGYKLINVRMNTYEAIQQIKEDTGASIADIMDAMTEFCIIRLEIKED
ncbi:MAG: hypothetical protein RSA41_06390 [Christensenella sp.]